MISTLTEKIAMLLGHHSSIVRAVRPFYARGLQFVAGGRGLAWTVNDQPLRISPRVRHLIPHVNEPDLFNFLRTNIKPGQTVLDIGSFLGIYAVFAARWVGPKGKVIAFEPTRANHSLIREHLRFNGVLERVELIEAAVGERSGTVNFCHFGESYMNRVLSPKDDLAMATVVKVRLVTLDEICAELRLVPDWIRMDVQGLEFDVLKGARAVIKSGRGHLRIVGEMHPQLWARFGLDETVARSLLSELGLGVRSLRSSRSPFEPDSHVVLDCVE